MSLFVVVIHTHTHPPWMGFRDEELLCLAVSSLDEQRRVRRRGYRRFDHAPARYDTPASSRLSQGDAVAQIAWIHPRSVYLPRSFIRMSREKKESGRVSDERIEVVCCATGAVEKPFCKTVSRFPFALKS